MITYDIEKLQAAVDRLEALMQSPGGSDVLISEMPKEVINILEPLGVGTVISSVKNMETINFTGLLSLFTMGLGYGLHLARDMDSETLKLGHLCRAHGLSEDHLLELIRRHLEKLETIREQFSDE